MCVPVVLICLVGYLFTALAIGAPKDGFEIRTYYKQVITGLLWVIVWLVIRSL